MKAEDNPFTPGAGLVPPLLSGREQVLETYRVILERVKMGKPNNPVFLYGLRGVGKTVLLNRIAEMAEERGYLVESMELDESSEMDFKALIFNRLKAILLKLDTVANLKSKFLAVLSILKSISFNYEGVEMSLDVEEALGEADSKNFQSDLSLLFQNLGKVAKNVNKPICIIIDELQNLNKENMAALLASIHKLLQLNLPIVIVGGGLPNLISTATEAKSYTERFHFVEVGPLETQAAYDALVIPILNKGAAIEKDAAMDIIAETKGYPYFIQMFGEILWNEAKSNQITKETAALAIPKAIKSLDNSFFESRYMRTTDEERKFMLCMAQTMVDDMSDTTTIGKCLSKSAQHVGQYRTRLINKGFIYSPKTGKVKFTVPLFADYIHRRELQ